VKNTEQFLDYIIYSHPTEKSIYLSVMFYFKYYKYILEVDVYLTFKNINTMFPIKFLCLYIICI
jgi:hypothetical protein